MSVLTNPSSAGVSSDELFAEADKIEGKARLTSTVMSMLV